MNVNAVRDNNYERKQNISSVTPLAHPHRARVAASRTHRLVPSDARLDAPPPRARVVRTRSQHQIASHRRRSNHARSARATARNFGLFMSLRLVRKLFPSLSIAPERLRSGSRAESSRAMRRGVFASRYDAPLRILILFFRPLYETRRESSRTARSSRVPAIPLGTSRLAREVHGRPRGGGFRPRNFSRRSNAPSSEVDARASRARREESSAFVRSFEMASRARDLERALAEPWPSHRCATALDEEVCETL